MRRLPPSSPLFPYTTLFRSALAAVVISGVPAGPGAPAVPPPRLGAAARALRRGSLRLVTLGYMGHMWELYARSEEHTSELQSQFHLVCRLLLEKKKRNSPVK